MDIEKSEICSVDLALLSYLGVNGRAFERLSAGADIRELLEASSLRRKSLSDDELKAKITKSEQYRPLIEEFQSRGGLVAGPGGAYKLGSLMRAPSPPLCAYVRGDPSLLTAPTKVAIVGTRDPSARGIARAAELAGRLSQAGVLVISGGALGIDLAAHRGCVEQGCPTLAVLGDPLRPSGDERPQRLLALKPQDLVSSVTLFGPWVKPSRSLFVARNQYVAALADAVVIIEGRPNSGTLHTARYANQIGVPVWVVPGDLGDEMSQAGNWLLEQGLARAFVRFEYFLSTLKMPRDPGIKRNPLPKQMPLIKTAPVREKIQLSEPQERLLGLFKQNEGRLTVDELADKCHTSISALQQELLMLELLGAIKKQGTEFLIA